MARAEDGLDRWLWYASRTGRCVPLESAAYPSFIFQGTPTPFPPWACQSPNGGLHIDDRLGRIDIDVASAPAAGIEMNWTCDFGVDVLSRAWLSEVEDLVDGNKVFVGDVRRKGRRMENWVTLNEARAPRLFSSDGWADTCPICGGAFSVLRGRRFFTDPSIRGRPLMVGKQGVFVREDLALGRNLRRPAGAFKPRVVRLLANPPKPKPAPAWITPLGSSVSRAEERQAPRMDWETVLSAISKVANRKRR